MVSMSTPPSPRALLSKAEARFSFLTPIWPQLPPPRHPVHRYFATHKHTQTASLIPCHPTCAHFFSVACSTKDGVAFGRLIRRGDPGPTTFRSRRRERFALVTRDPGAVQGQVPLPVSRSSCSEPCHLRSSPAMLSLVSGFGAVARRQACKLPAVRAMASTSAQTSTVDKNPYSEISDYIHDIAEEQKTIAAGSTGEVVEGGDAVPEPRRTSTPCCSIPLTSKPCLVSPIGAKGFPTLTGFRTNQVRNALLYSPLPLMFFSPTVRPAAGLHAGHLRKNGGTELVHEAGAARPWRVEVALSRYISPNEHRPLARVAELEDHVPLRHLYGQDQGSERDEPHVAEPAAGWKGHSPREDDGDHPGAQQTDALARREAVTATVRTVEQIPLCLTHTLRRAYSGIHINRPPPFYSAQGFVERYVPIREVHPLHITLHHRLPRVLLPPVSQDRAYEDLHTGPSPSLGMTYHSNRSSAHTPPRRGVWGVRETIPASSRGKTPASGPSPTPESSCVRYRTCRCSTLHEHQIFATVYRYECRRIWRTPPFAPFSASAQLGPRVMRA